MQQFEQAIRSPLTGKSGRLAAGVVRFVNDDDVPRLGLFGEFSEYVHDDASSGWRQ